MLGSVSTSHSHSLLDQLRRIRRKLLFRLTFIIVATCLILGLVHPTAPPWRSSCEPPLDLRAMLESLPRSEGFAYSRDGISDLEPLGTKADMIKFDSRGVVDAQTGLPLTGVESDVVFNLAVLRLPEGSKWDFVGIARGPTRSRSFITVNGHPGREQVLVLLGLNVTAEGALLPVTTGRTLHIPMIPTAACLPVGHWAATYGAEDPRLMYTDSGAPALVFGRLSDRHDKCRSLSFMSDLRYHSDELADAMSTAFEGGLGAGEAVEREMVWGGKQTLVEKNWSPFYPGALPNRTAVYPHVHYSLFPDTSLQPSFVGRRNIDYTEIPRNERYADCVHTAHPELPGRRLHQATPLYRLTLCNRLDPRCQPSIHNTVYLTLVHIELRPQYTKLFITYNTTAPYEPITVGPGFLMNGLNDVTEISYVLALSPLVAGRPTGVTTRSVGPPINPDHFFLDDDILVTMGVKDVTMASSVISVMRALERHKLCADIMD